MHSSGPVVRFHAQVPRPMAGPNEVTKTRDDISRCSHTDGNLGISLLKRLNAMGLFTEIGDYWFFWASLADERTS